MQHASILAHQHINTSARQHTSSSNSSCCHLLGDLGAVLSDVQANEAKVDLQGQDGFHQQGQRAKHKQQNPKEETLYKKICNSRSTAPGGCYVKENHETHEKNERGQRNRVHGSGVVRSFGPQLKK